LLVSPIEPVKTQGVCMKKSNKLGVQAVRQPHTTSAVRVAPKWKKANGKSGAGETFKQKLILAVVPSVFTCIATVVAMNSYYAAVPSLQPPAPIPTPQSSLMIGRPIATYKDYPVVADQTGTLRLDSNLFSKCVQLVLDNNDQRAAADLFYLGQQNHIETLLKSEGLNSYKQLRSRFDLKDFEDVNKQRDEVFEVYKDVVNGVGQTFAGTPVEIVLHDTRDPLHSIVAIQNAISGRKLRGPNTNFGIQLIKHYSNKDERMESYISYPLTLKDGRAIKSTTIPLYHAKYGLIGFVCMNIDTSQLKKEEGAINNDYIKQFLAQFAATDHNQHVDELIENSNQK
jgi:predicted transcriptional regulator YheO